MEISIIKLVNGETLLAEVTHEDKEHMSIIDPIEVNVHLRNGTPVLISTIWMPLTKTVNLFHVRQAHIILESKVDNDMKIYYNRCMETIRESTTEDNSFLFDRIDDDELTPEEMESALNHIHAVRGFAANTAIH